MIDFKGAHYPREVILYAVFFYVRYGVSYRDLEEIMAERGVLVDHATLNRWVVRYSPLIAAEAKKRKQSVAGSWRMDEAAATAFFKQAIDHNEWPSKVVIDKSGANNAGLENINILVFLAGLLCFIDRLKVKYLNNIVEQDHRFIKKITKPMMGFKAFHSARGRQGISKLSYAKGLAIDIHRLTQCDPSPTARYAEEDYHRPLCLGF